MRRNISGVHAHSELTAGEKMFCRNLRDGDERCRMLHPFSVFGRPKDVDRVVWSSESLHAFVALLAVIKTRSHTVNAKVRVLDEDW